MFCVLFGLGFFVVFDFGEFGVYYVVMCVVGVVGIGIGICSGIVLFGGGCCGE